MKDQTAIELNGFPEENSNRGVFSGKLMVLFSLHRERWSTKAAICHEAFK